ncbi:unnamed protein product, partial [Porites evermanni]
MTQPTRCSKRLSKSTKKDPKFLYPDLQCQLKDWHFLAKEPENNSTFKDAALSAREYNKLDLLDFVTSFLSMIKPYKTHKKNAMLDYLELLMLKPSSYSGPSVRDFLLHPAKQIELRRLEWTSSPEIRNKAVILLYFDTRYPFGLKTFAMICQPTTKAVIYSFTQSSITADVYLNDFYGADSPEQAPLAFDSLKALSAGLGFQSASEKDSPPSTCMVCLGVEVDS